ncbi:MAG: hypothetical protein KatS3mg076_0406 [Candidatus Binatia bacterium]|nr:MAG: hypothetical protein KatS3mg076_0406 [Candidatus Binatia bacterium]
MEWIFDPGLLEDVVFLALRGRPEEGEFHAERERLYEIEEEETREAAFAELARRWFVRLGLWGTLERAFGEVPIVPEKCVRCLVRRASKRSEEGAELLVSSERGHEERTVRLLLRAESFLRPGELLGFLRGELLRLGDILDPAFGYDPKVPHGVGDRIPFALFQDRYRVAWDASLVGRMVRAGWLPPEEREAAFASFRKVLGSSGNGAADRTFAGFFDRRPTHEEIVAFALDPGLGRAATCRSCGAVLYPPAALAHSAFPREGERLRHELCAQCSDLLREREKEARRLGGAKGGDHADSPG